MLNSFFGGKKGKKKKKSAEDSTAAVPERRPARNASDAGGDADKATTAVPSPTSSPEIALPEATATPSPIASP